VLLGGFTVDVYWPEWNLVIELDSPGYHMTPSAFERDPVRDAAIQKAGCRVLRVTTKRLANQPAGVLADILALKS
jgi:very-short-patch-repair endonuclease